MTPVNKGDLDLHYHFLAQHSLQATGRATWLCPSLHPKHLWNSSNQCSRGKNVPVINKHIKPEQIEKKKHCKFLSSAYSDKNPNLLLSNPFPDLKIETSIKMITPNTIQKFLKRKAICNCRILSLAISNTLICWGARIVTNKKGPSNLE